MAPARIQNHRAAFWDAITAYRERPFVWGEHDCVLFAARMVDAITNAGIVERIHREYPYRDAASAARLMAAHGGLRGLATQLLGPERPPDDTCFGDVGLAIIGSRTSMVVYDGSQFFGPSYQHLEKVDFEHVVCVWKI